MKPDLAIVTTLAECRNGLYDEDTIYYGRVIDKF